MKRLFFLSLALVVLCGCIDKHPYKYVINENIPKPDKLNSVLQIEDIENETRLPMSQEKQDELTRQICNYLKGNGFNVARRNNNTSESCEKCFVLKPKIITAIAEISNNMAGWHGTSEDPFSFWSHFTPAINMPMFEDSVDALSLYVEINSGGQEYFENAGGIELMGKYNRYSFRTTDIKEMVSDNKKFIKAMDIAFKPLLKAVK